MKIYISIDKKYKSQGTIKSQIEDALKDAKAITGKKVTAVDTLENADCAYFVDEWEDDIDCFKEHSYCIEHDIKILHDKSVFWNKPEAEPTEE